MQMQDHSKIAELERRITAALERIGSGLDAFAKASVSEAMPVPPSPSQDADASDASDGQTEVAKVAATGPSPAEIQANNRMLRGRVATLMSELQHSNAQVAELTEQLKTSKAREIQPQIPTDAKVEKMTQQLDVQGLELQRMRKSTVQLREHLRILHEAAAAQAVQPHMINKAMLAELESLRATRHSETAEMDEILAEIRPLIAEAHHNG
jgi:hypothetical protein